MALRLKDKFDQRIYNGKMPVISDVKSVYSHSNGELTGVVSINGNKCKVTNTRGLWSINK
jgi:hypothetical protein